MAALQKSIQPLLIVLVLCGLLVFAFAVMMTSLVPDAVEDGDEVREVALENYGSVARSMRALLEVFDGSASCSVDTVFTLFDAAQTGRFGAASMLLARLLASSVLFLATSGLVTGVFIEQLFSVMSRVEERAQRKELLRSHECLTILDQVFSDLGYDSEEHVTWAAIETGLELNPSVQDRLDINLEDAHRLFLQLDEDNDGSVQTEEFIFSMFKLKTMSKSIDMLSIDYQQENALRRLSELHNALGLSLASIKSRLLTFTAMLPAMERKIRDVTAGIDEVARLEGDLSMAKRAREDSAAKAQGGEPSASSGYCIQTLRANYHLDDRLTALEQQFAAFEEQANGKDVLHASDEDVAAIADGIVQSIKECLREELREAKATAASMAANAPTGAAK